MQTRGRLIPWILLCSSAAIATPVAWSLVRSTSRPARQPARVESPRARLVGAATQLRQSRPMERINRMEDAVGEVQRDVLGVWRDAWLARADDVDFFDLKGVVEELVLQHGGDEAVFDTGGERPAWAHPRAWARVRAGDDTLGHVAVVHPDVVEAAEMGKAAVVAELRLDALAVRRRQPVAKAPPRHPAALGAAGRPVRPGRALRLRRGA